MTDKKSAVALRSFTHADDSYAKGQPIPDMDPGQFADWSAKGVDLVREATADDVHAAAGDASSEAIEPPADA